MPFRKKVIFGLLGMTIFWRLPLALLKQDSLYFPLREGYLNPVSYSVTNNSSTSLEPEDESDSNSTDKSDGDDGSDAVVVGTFDETIALQSNHSHETNVSMMTTSPQEVIATSESKSWDTSIMITSNLIPTHPNIDMLKDTIYSLHKYLVGIPMDIPIYVVVDGLPEKKLTPENQKREEQYIQAVRDGNFTPLTNVMVVPMGVHRNLAGSVKHTLENHVQTEFLYIIQHDLPFFNKVLHTKLLPAMRDHPDVLYNIRFRYNNKLRTRGGHCYSYHNMSDFPPEDFSGLDIFSTDAFSDNNHLTTKNYYTYLLSRMKHHRRAMEAAVGWKARYNCTYWGQQIYGRRDDRDMHICHLNGRVSQSYNDASKANMTGWEMKAIWCRNQVYRTLNETDES